MDRKEMFSLESQEIRERRRDPKWIIAMFLIVGFVIVALFGFCGFMVVTRRTNNEVTTLQPHHTNDTPPKPEGRPLTFNFRNTMQNYNFPQGTFTCSIENSRDNCPDPIQKWNKLIEFLLKNQFLENNDTTKVSYFSQIFFAEENKVIYKIREIYGLRDEIVFISRNVDWKRKVPFGLLSREIKVVKTETEMDYSPCFQDKTMAISECKLVDPNQPCWYEHNLCKISEPMVKDVTNLVNALLGMKYFNLTWTTGEGLDKKTMLTEYFIEGKLNDNTTPKDFYDRTELFYKQQKDWCDCVEKKAASWSYSEEQKLYDWDRCFILQSIRPEFEAVLDYKMCPVELERRIGRYNAKG